ncbi:hypothetical protein [Streptomyces sp. NPDC002520]
MIDLARPDGQRAYAYPHGLVHTDPALRPTAEAIAASGTELVAAVTAETAGCSICRRVLTFWSEASRCIVGKRLLSELGKLHYYRDNVLPWLAGLPADPARLRGGQHVTVHTTAGELAGVVSVIDDHGQWHEPGTDGLVLLRHRDGTPPTRYPAATVFHLP